MDWVWGWCNDRPSLRKVSERGGRREDGNSAVNKAVSGSVVRDVRRVSWVAASASPAVVLPKRVVVPGALITRTSHDRGPTPSSGAAHALGFDIVQSGS
ncbi:hypothetical protein CALVIDRAFT_540222 [Calocera viscosa TUFC12733]|uniref:Uncharacterized protein n=1 Tax=Calocera viscosa (strain TUFC12733) TaxID=1330018 RepID=A0A167J4B1_CALVF|nr:hypothetical protein CALVIDRAFT_540222 [Calocera viscosa TUFC12733]